MRVATFRWSAERKRVVYGSSQAKTVELPHREAAVARRAEAAPHSRLPQVQRARADAHGLPKLWFLHGADGDGDGIVV
jgi:hypothetical protein